MNIGNSVTNDQTWFFGQMTWWNSNAEKFNICRDLSSCRWTNCCSPIKQGGVSETCTSGIHSKCKTSRVINSNIRGPLLFMLWISHTCSAPSLDLLLNPFLFRLREVCCNNVQKTVSDTAFASVCKYPSWMKPFVVSLQKWKLSDCLCNSRWCLFQTWKYWFRERTAQLQ